MGRPKIISIVIEDVGDGLLRATSPQVHGLFLHGETVDELKEAVPAVLEAMFRSVGQSVRVLEADDEAHSIPMPWVILPSERVAC